MKELQDNTTNITPSIIDADSPKLGDVLIRVEKVSKKLCKDLKKSLWYGVKDMGNEMLGRTRKATLRDKEFWAVNAVSFELRRGQCLGLMGSNGAGKSTMLKMLNGLIKPDKGKITLLGRVGSLIELNAGFNPILSGRENTYINGAILGFSKEEIDSKFDDILAFSEIGDFIDSPVQNYSSGMKVRLGFAIAAHLEPDILLIDEVLAVGDVGFRTKCLDKLKEMLPYCCVVFVSHITGYTREICTDVLLLDKGKIVFYGDDVEEGVRQYEWMTMSEGERGKIIKIEEAKENKEEKEKEIEEPLLEIRSCELFQVDQPKDTLVFTQFCELKLNVKANVLKYSEKYALGFFITDENDKSVIVSRSDLFDLDKECRVKISVIFKNILLPGKYKLNLHFIGRTLTQVKLGGRATFNILNCKTFEVKGNRRLLNIPIQYEANWKEIKNVGINQKKLV